MDMLTETNVGFFQSLHFQSIREGKASKHQLFRIETSKIMIQPYMENAGETDASYYDSV